MYLEGGRSMPLGADPLGQDKEAELPVAPGDTILLYTDGLVERRGAGIDEGLERLVEAVSAGPDDPDALLAFIVAELVPEHQRLDDVAVIALKSSAA